MPGRWPVGSSAPAAGRIAPVSHPQPLGPAIAWWRCRRRAMCRRANGRCWNRIWRRRWCGCRPRCDRDDGGWRAFTIGVRRASSMPCWARSSSTFARVHLFRHLYGRADPAAIARARRGSRRLRRARQGCDGAGASGSSPRGAAAGLLRPRLRASIVRESVPFPDGSPNPMPLIQIPYARLKQKYNLTSILHEAGHQALTRMGLVNVLPRAFPPRWHGRGAGRNPRSYALWAFEIGPDFWAFCSPARPRPMRSAICSRCRLRTRSGSPSPIPTPTVPARAAFVRVVPAGLGSGPLDAWEAEWISLYPLRAAPPETRRLLMKARVYLSVISDVLFRTRFTALGGRALPDLFDLARSPRRRSRGSPPARARGCFAWAACRPVRSGRLPCPARVGRARRGAVGQSHDHVAARTGRETAPGRLNQRTEVGSERHGAGSVRLQKNPQPRVAEGSCDADRRRLILAVARRRRRRPASIRSSCVQSCRR